MFEKFILANVTGDHLANLPDERRRNPGQIDPHLAIARAKIEDAESFEEALAYITSKPGVWVTTAREIAEYYYENYYDICQADILTRKAG